MKTSSRDSRRINGDSLRSGSTDRRSFLNTLITFFLFLVTMAVFYPLGAFLWPGKEEGESKGPLNIPLDEIPKDASKIYPYREGKVIVIRSGKRVIALSGVCTHMGCLLKYNRKGFIECPCHGGKFDLNGTVVSGPPPKPLRTFPARIAGSRIIVGG